jgi:mutator protein MutT
MTDSLPRKQIGVAIIINDRGEILIDRRLDQGAMANLWEFPGGKVEPGESFEECVIREIKEEIGLDIAIEQHLATFDHDYPQFHLTFGAYHCSVVAGEPKAIACQEVRWVTPKELSNFNFPEANYVLIELIQTQVS